MLKIKKNEKLLLFVGRLSPHKNLHALLDIFNLVNEKEQKIVSNLKKALEESEKLLSKKIKNIGNK